MESSLGPDDRQVPSARAPGKLASNATFVVTPRLGVRGAAAGHPGREIAIRNGMESTEYRHIVDGQIEGIKILKAMRSKRA